MKHVMMHVLIAAWTVLGLIGCQSGGEPQPLYNASDRVWVSPSGSYALDPVSGEAVDTKNARTVEYGGVTYYFASDENFLMFEKDPGRYAAPYSSERSDYPVD